MTITIGQGTRRYYVHWQCTRTIDCIQADSLVQALNALTGNTGYRVYMHLVGRYVPVAYR